MRFEKGRNIGTLQETQVEIWETRGDRPTTSVWRTKLVFVDTKGRWLIGGKWWHLNQRKAAEKEILGMGYKKLEDENV